MEIFADVGKSAEALESRSPKLGTGHQVNGAGALLPFVTAVGLFSSMVPIFCKLNGPMRPSLRVKKPN